VTTSAGTVFDVSITPAQRSIAYADSDPGYGCYNIGGTVFNVSNATSGQHAFKYVTSAGAGSSAQWAATAAYRKGAWIRTSTNKVLECIVPGTSGSVEPTSSTLGEELTDGEVTWIYRSATRVT